jgi:hypothetical protein
MARRRRRITGAVAQLGERCNRTAEVRGSTPLSSTGQAEGRGDGRHAATVPARHRSSEVEHSIRNRAVVSSILTGGSCVRAGCGSGNGSVEGMWEREREWLLSRSHSLSLSLAVQAGVAQLVEHQLPKLRVAGSSPVSRSVVRCWQDGWMMPLGVTGNTSDSGSEESWFEPRRGNSKDARTRGTVWRGSQVVTATVC